MDPTTVEGRFRWLVLALLGAIAVSGAVDLALDHFGSLWSLHFLVEMALLVVSLGGVGFLCFRWRDAGRALEQTRRDLAARRAERDAWRGRAEKFLLGLGEEIDRQLRKWGLTPAERETALLLLKGYGHKEIAALQEKSERTVRQHAVAIYRKSGLSGRTGLSAYFLEDLLLPVAEQGPSRDRDELHF
jgi:DNA-binding CsgD family transcriptional regulator